MILPKVKIFLTEATRLRIPMQKSRLLHLPNAIHSFLLRITLSLAIHPTTAPLHPAAAAAPPLPRPCASPSPSRQAADARPPAHLLSLALAPLPPLALVAGCRRPTVGSLPLPRPSAAPSPHPRAWPRAHPQRRRPRACVRRLAAVATLDARGRPPGADSPRAVPPTAAALYAAVPEATALSLSARSSPCAPPPSFGLRDSMPACDAPPRGPPPDVPAWISHARCARPPPSTLSSLAAAASHPNHWLAGTCPGRS